MWYFDLEKKDTVQLTKDNNQNFQALAGHPMASMLFMQKGRLSIKLYMVHRKGGGGIQLTEGSFSLKTIDPAVSADGRYVYYSQRYGPWNYNAQLPQYEIGKYDRETVRPRSSPHATALDLRRYCQKMGNGSYTVAGLKIRQALLYEILKREKKMARLPGAARRTGIYSAPGCITCHVIYAG